MSNNVFANGNAIACKAGDDKVIASMPDVCLSPPSPPAGPVPVPYPNTSFSKDMKSGSKTVEINGKEVMLKDKSFYKTSPLGDEAATNSFGGSVITHTITGKTYFSAWSMDVKFEGENVPRHLDLTTSNHNPYPGSTAPTPAQEEALKAISEHRCPCCKKKECVAAFKEGDEPLTEKEFYTLGKDAAGVKKWEDEAAAFRDLNIYDCTCPPFETAVFPSPPCDVYRKPDDARHTAIEAAWDPVPYRKWYQRTYGVVLKTAADILGGLLAAAPNGAALLAASKEGRGGGKSPNRKAFDALNDKASKLERINHLTPKEAGGCPTSTDNLQPQQALCETCQSIDQEITDNWQGKKKGKK